MEEDFKAINNYDRAILELTNERMRYRKFLEEEKSNIEQLIKDNINEFNNDAFKLFQIKLKYNSAIKQEYLKIIRLSKQFSESDQRKQQVKQLS